MRVQTQNIGIQLKSSAISDPVKIITASKGVVIQKEDARTPKKPLKCPQTFLFKI
jgi:hypothetical protein